MRFVLRAVWLGGFGILGFCFDFVLFGLVVLLDLRCFAVELWLGDFGCGCDVCVM